MNERAVSLVMRLASPSILQGSVHFTGQGMIAPLNDRDTDLLPIEFNTWLTQCQ